MIVSIRPQIGHEKKVSFPPPWGSNIKFGFKIRPMRLYPLKRSQLVCGIQKIKFVVPFLVFPELEVKICRFLIFRFEATHFWGAIVSPVYILEGNRHLHMVGLVELMLLEPKIVQIRLKMTKLWSKKWLRPQSLVLAWRPKPLFEP